MALNASRSSTVPGNPGIVNVTYPVLVVGQAFECDCKQIVLRRKQYENICDQVKGDYSQIVITTDMTKVALNVSVTS